MRKWQRITKKWVAMLLTLTMCMSLISAPAFADGEEPSAPPAVEESAPDTALDNPAPAPEEPASPSGEETPAEVPETPADTEVSNVPDDETPADTPEDEAPADTPENQPSVDAEEPAVPAEPGTTPTEPSVAPVVPPTAETPVEQTGKAEPPTNPVVVTPLPAVTQTTASTAALFAASKTVVKEIPAEVQAFFDAVAAIPTDINADNVETAGDLINAAFDAYEALVDAGLNEYDGVAEALSTVEAAYMAVDAVLGMKSSNYYLPTISGKTPADRFYYDGEEVAQLYVGTYANNPVYKYDNPETSITIHVGETGSDQYLYTKSATCHCGNVLVEVTPDWIAVDSNRKLSNSEDGITDNIAWSLVGYEAEDYSDVGYEGYPALQLSVDGVKPGLNTITFQSYQNYYYYYTWQQCKNCGQWYSEISFKGKWIEDTQHLNVTVNADYVLNYNLNGGTATPTIQSPQRVAEAATSYTFTIPSTMPEKDNATFKGWSEENISWEALSDAEKTEIEKNLHQPGQRITLEWTKGNDDNGNLIGSTANPVTKTLYAIWSEDNTDNTPNAPEREDLNSILGYFVKVECISVGDGLPHGEKKYSIWGGQVDGKYESEVGEVYEDGDTYKVNVTLNGNVYAAMYGCDPTFGTGVSHELAKDEETTKTITLTWDSTNQKWTSGQLKGTPLATFRVVCKTSEPEKANYKVEWYVVGSETPFRTDNTRSGEIGKDVFVTEQDKNVEGYTFVEDHENNILTTTVTEDGNAVLKLYFTQNTTTPGGGGGSTTDPDPIDPGTSDPDPVDPGTPDYPGDPVEPTPTPGGGSGGGTMPSPTPTPTPSPTPTTEMPEADVPLASVPVAELPEADVPLANEPEVEMPLVELAEDDVPLADVPKTGDSGLAWLLAMLASMLGLGFLSVRERKEAK